MIFKTASQTLSPQELSLHVERFLRQELPRRQRLTE